MKKQLDWQDRKIVNIFDEISLWAAPFGSLLLENIPMKAAAKVLDLGFGTGFPLIELSQRFGEKASIYGMDIWKNAILRTKKKLKTLDIENITIFEQSVTLIPLPDNSIDLITSNLGFNNFEEKEQVLKESFRVLMPGGNICITTNPVGTFNELFVVFDEVLQEMDLTESIKLLHQHIAHRGTKDTIIRDFENIGFKKVKSLESSKVMRFVDAEAVFDHSLIRIGFMVSWDTLIAEPLKNNFYEKAIEAIRLIIKRKGEFQMSVPILYLSFEKEAI